MSVWDYLFKTEPTESRTDEETIASEEEAMHAAVSSMTALRRELHEAQRQIDQLQLVCEALVSLLELKGGIERQELSLMIQRLDLADGVEDNRLGPDKSADAPKCSHCGRPVNPSRTQCIYCFTRLPGPRDTLVTGPPPELPQVVCARCGVTVDEMAAQFSDDGLVCATCAEPGR